jgi:hypothetical protein
MARRSFAGLRSKSGAPTARHANKKVRVLLLENLSIFRNPAFDLPSSLARQCKALLQNPGERQV